jgi:hypothetical protein
LGKGEKREVTPEFVNMSKEILYPQIQGVTAHRTVRCITGQSDELYPYAADLFPRAAFSPKTSLAQRTLSGAPPDSPMCQTELSFGCTEPSLFGFFSSSFLTVSRT